MIKKTGQAMEGICTIYVDLDKHSSLYFAPKDSNSVQLSTFLRPLSKI